MSVVCVILCPLICSSEPCPCSSLSVAELPSPCSSSSSGRPQLAAALVNSSPPRWSHCDPCASSKLVLISNSFERCQIVDSSVSRRYPHRLCRRRRRTTAALAAPSPPRAAPSSRGLVLPLYRSRLAAVRRRRRAPLVGHGSASLLLLLVVSHVTSPHQQPCHLIGPCGILVDVLSAAMWQIQIPPDLKIQ